MRILLLSDIDSEHIEKWAIGLAEMNIQVGLFSFNKAKHDWFKNKINIELLFQPEETIEASGFLSKLLYIKHRSLLNKKINEFKPDILHAHYASSYGLLGALSGFHPYVISAWGTDVMKFPQESPINKLILKYNLKRADVICATSNTINGYVKTIASKATQVIPFGVNFDDFKQNNSLKKANCFVIGTIKPLEAIYNIDKVIRVFAIIHPKNPETELMIVGDGSEKENLLSLVKQLNLENSVKFTGRVKFSETPNYFNQLNCLVNISQYESFGVSVVEAMACKVPVIVSNTGGLKEVVVSNEMGFLVDPGNIEQTAAAIEKMINDKPHVDSIVEKAYASAKERFDWNVNLKQQIVVYQNLLVK